MEGTNQFLEDMELILAESSSDSPITILEEDLAMTMPSRDTPEALVQQTQEQPENAVASQRLLELRNRLEKFLVEEMAEVDKKEVQSIEEPKELLKEVNGTEPQLQRSVGEAKNVQEHTSEEAKDDEMDSRTVWIVEPGFDTGDFVFRFKLRSDDRANNGSSFIVKGTEAHETVKIIKKAYKNVQLYFQVHTIGGGVSRIVQPDKINQIVKEMLTDEKPSIEKDEDAVSPEKFDVEKKVTHRPGTRLLHYVISRRRKALVRRQVLNIAAGSKQ